MKLNEVIGQSALAEQLKQLCDEGRMPHALMLYGATGYGTMAMAMALACRLLGEKDAQPDDGLGGFFGGLSPEDERARRTEAMLKNWQHPDLHFAYPVVRPASASSDQKIVSDDYSKEWHEMLEQGVYFEFDEWLKRMKAENKQAHLFEAESDNLTHKLTLKASQGGKKVCVMWMPELMKVECENKILKLLEEPPAETYFIMASEKPELLLETIRSRVQSIAVKPIQDENLAAALVEKRGIDAETARIVSRQAFGNWNRALNLLTGDKERIEQLQFFIDLMRLCWKRDVRGLKAWSESVAAIGREKQRQLMAYFTYLLRENFVFNFHEPQLNRMTREEEAFVEKFCTLYQRR